MRAVSSANPCAIFFGFRFFSINTTAEFSSWTKLKALSIYFVISYFSAMSEALFSDAKSITMSSEPLKLLMVSSCMLA